MAEKVGNVIELDFSGAPPSVGPNFVHIPAGKYPMVIVSLEQKSSKKGSPMVQAAFGVASGPHAGKKIADYFTLPTGPQSSKVGLQRLHAMLVALGLKQMTGKASIPLDKLKGRKLIVEVEDNQMDPTDDYPSPRTVSRPAAYFRATGAAPAAEPVAEVVADNGAAPEAALEDTTEATEATPEAAVEEAAEPVAAAAATEQFADDLEALFEE